MCLAQQLLMMVCGLREKFTLNPENYQGPKLFEYPSKVL